jgi:hypothetical protein
VSNKKVTKVAPLSLFSIINLILILVKFKNLIYISLWQIIQNLKQEKFIIFLTEG